MKDFMDGRARLMEAEFGHHLYMFKENGGGYVCIISDMEEGVGEDAPCVLGMISARDEKNSCSCQVLDTPEKFNEFMKKALNFLRGE